MSVKGHREVVNKIAKARGGHRKKHWQIFSWNRTAVLPSCWAEAENITRNKNPIFFSDPGAGSCQVTDHGGTRTASAEHRLWDVSACESGNLVLFFVEVRVFFLSLFFKWLRVRQKSPWEDQDGGVSIRLG